jgi:hypothetical protein
LPEGAVAGLTECVADPDDAVRVCAARALRRAPPEVAEATFARLLDDPNPRIGLLAAGYLLGAAPGHPEATAVVADALREGPAGVCRAAVELVASLGEQGAAFLDALRDRAAAEPDPGLSDRMGEVIEQLERGAAEGKAPEPGRPEIGRPAGGLAGPPVLT